MLQVFLISRMHSMHVDFLERRIYVYNTELNHGTEIDEERLLLRLQKDRATFLM